MVIGQHVTAITPDGMSNGGTYVTIANPEGASVVYGNSNQQRMTNSTDVNNNDVTIPTSGIVLHVLHTYMYLKLNLKKYMFVLLSYLIWNVLIMYWLIDLVDSLMDY